MVRMGSEALRRSMWGASLPAPGHGSAVMYTLSPSENATQRPSGEGAASSAKGKVRWTRRSEPSALTETSRVTSWRWPPRSQLSCSGKKRRPSGPKEGATICLRGISGRPALNGRSVFLITVASPPPAGMLTRS